MSVTFIYRQKKISVFVKTWSVFRNTVTYEDQQVISMGCPVLIFLEVDFSQHSNTTILWYNI